MNGEIKRHIDAARQVLVGVVPNPSEQINQITYALIYKFMDDMDQASIKAGDDPAFFVGQLERFAWTRLMDTKIGNQERLNLYVEAFIKFGEAKQLPELFRNILKSAFLPYRSPEVLGLFLKEINYFDYSHPEELGNAYEYLLSIMSSQGDAGQFRTPRHIIDFIVDVVNPTKDDKVLDPACGTGGFLISSYKHILAQHDGKDDPQRKEKPLTPDQRKKLMNNFEGYDIDPGMVRIAQVNMYLHQFKNPKIYQYDSLSQEERWGDKFDVILANPPFMSPKGGIKPHSKFSVQSSRSEVLFVDYIMNHLRPKGRAGIIVPEGIIFQSGSSHKQLRKNLVEDGLYAVVSLPSGVFAPYSGVKTSILLFDNELAKRSDEVLFVKIENDGFDLGATKRPINKNDLPGALALIRGYQIHLQSDRLEVAHEWANSSDFSHTAKKSKITENNDYNLSGDRYRTAIDNSSAKWPMVELGAVCKILNGCAFKSDQFNDQKIGIPVIRIRDVNSGFSETYYSGEYDEKFIVNDGDLLIGMDGDFIATLWKHGKSLLNQRVCRLQDFSGVHKKYIYFLVQKELSAIQEKTYAVTVKHLSSSQIEKIKIPLPPLEIQNQIVAELDGYAGIIAGAKQIVDNWKPDFHISNDTKKTKVGDVVDFVSGVTLAIGDCENENGVPIITIADVTENGGLKLNSIRKVKTDKKVNVLKRGDLLFNWRNGSKNLVGKTAFFDLDEEYIFASFLLGIRPKKELVESKFLWFLLNKYRAEGKYMNFMRQNVNGLFNREELKDVVIPIPPLEIQKQIVEKIEAERSLVESSKKLIEIYEQKTKAVVDKLWS